MSGTLQGRRAEIVGGGIGGLTAALALAHFGAEVTLHEQADAFREVGAGIQISPNAGRVIEALGLGAALNAVSCRARAVQLHDMRGRRVAAIPLSTPDGSAFRFVHRARLVELLSAAAQARGVRLNLSSRIETPPPAAGLVIGADGLHSRLRAMLNGAQTPFFTGQTAWRALIRDTSPDDAARVYMGPGRHLVSYRLAEGWRNLVAVIERESWQDEGWSHRDDPANLRAAFSRFEGPVPNWLSQVDEVGIWGLFRHEIAARWQDGRVALIGDAAHPTLPFLAQGAVMAIEDAWILAECLNAEPDQAQALARYQALRVPRVTRLVEAANANARNYHLRGPAASVAHLGLRAVSWVAPAALAERYRWIYDYDPTAAIKAAV